MLGAPTAASWDSSCICVQETVWEPVGATFCQIPPKLPDVAPVIVIGEVDAGETEHKMIQI